MTTGEKIATVLKAVMSIAAGVGLIALMVYFAPEVPTGGPVIVEEAAAEISPEASNALLVSPKLLLDLEAEANGYKAELDALRAEFEAIKNREPQTITKTIEVIKEVEVMPRHAYSDIVMTENEKHILWWIVALEAGTQPDIGQRAVVEVIFNRVLSDEWPNTVEEVLYQPIQFSTIPYLTHPYCDATDKEMDNINYVLEHGRTALPEDYVFFGKSKVNGKDFIQIQDHYFSRAK